MFSQKLLGLNVNEVMDLYEKRKEDLNKLKELKKDIKIYNDFFVDCLKKEYNSNEEIGRYKESIKLNEKIMKKYDEEIEIEERVLKITEFHLKVKKNRT